MKRVVAVLGGNAFALCDEPLTMEAQIRIADLAARRLQRHFASGSMRPKAEAAIQFASQPARRAIICDVESLPATLAGEAGTRVEGVPCSQAA